MTPDQNHVCTAAAPGPIPTFAVASRRDNSEMFNAVSTMPSVVSCRGPMRNSRPANRESPPLFMATIPQNSKTARRIVADFYAANALTGL